MKIFTDVFRTSKPIELVGRIDFFETVCKATKIKFPTDY